MKLLNILSPRILLVLGVATALSSAGCNGGGDTAPTNTKGSEYINTGDTSADKVGADRAAAHRPRLPGKGATGG
jgi:hypothetical protein